MKELPRKARLYITGIIALGAFSLIQGLWDYQWYDLRLFAVLALLGALTAKLKIRTPGILGTVSVSYAFVFVAIMLLSPTETIILSGICGLAQCLIKPEHRPQTHQVAFSVSALMLSAYAASWAYRLTKTSVQYDDMQGQAIALVAATVIYFLINSLSVSAVIGLTSRVGILQTWHKNFLWYWACFFAAAIIAWMLAIYIRRLGLTAFILALPPLALIYYTYRLYLGRVEDGQRHIKQIQEMHLSTVEALARAIEARDQAACEHIQRVQAYAVCLAQALQLGEGPIQAIKEAALLHDIGKLGVPEYILKKPGSLTPQEFDRISIHPLIGYQILSTINFQYPVAEIVLCHHERWDGTGYPNRMKAEQIPIGARVLAVADCFEVLTVGRHYRKALSPEEAIAHILSERGRAFDPKMVDVFYSVVDSLQRAGDAAMAQALEKWSRAGSGGGAPAQTAPAARAALPRSAYETIGAVNQELSAVYDLAQVVGTTLRLNETLRLVATKLHQMVPSSTVAFFLLEHEELVFRCAQGVEESSFHGQRFAIGQGILGWVAAHRQSVLNADAELDRAARSEADARTRLRSVLAVPLIADEQFIGVVALYDLQPNRFDEDSLRLMEGVSGKIAAALRNSILFEQTHQEALTDPVTGLPNSRFLFMRLDQEISRASRQGASLTVLVMDLDHFKQINDTMGHLIGDKVLIQVGQVLRSFLREYDFLARTGGDEFAALLIDMDPESVRHKVGRIEQAIADFKIDGKGAPPVPLGISIGCATYGVDGGGADALLTTADAAMYRIKNERKQANSLKMG